MAAVWYNFNDVESDKSAFVQMKQCGKEVN